ncbi:MAG: DNA topoisomerase IB [Burkholderiales bacterium]
MARKPKPFAYTSDAEPGIARVARGDTFLYFRAEGRPVRRATDLARIASLAIPPAWTEVWICPDPRGHLQATGKDARGRKQYRYHPAWIAERDSNKFASLADFARALPRIRRAVVRDLRRPALCKERVLAAVVRLMDQAFVRVGNERYRRDNGSFGATTLRARHVRASRDGVVLDFRGKSGKRHTIRIDDARVVRVIRRCLELPGDVLFQYKDGETTRSISGADVNAYLKSISGSDITSKDFRTWGGTVRAANLLWSGEQEGSQSMTRTAMRACVRDAIEAASQALGNTPAVCRRSYIHPRIFRCYEAGITVDPPSMRGLRADERRALALLDAKLPTLREQLERSVAARGGDVRLAA